MAGFRLSTGSGQCSEEQDLLPDFVAPLTLGIAFIWSFSPFLFTTTWNFRVLFNKSVLSAIFCHHGNILLLGWAGTKCSLVLSAGAAWP